MAHKIKPCFLLVDLPLVSLESRAGRGRKEPASLREEDRRLPTRRYNVALLRQQVAVHKDT